MRRRALIQMLEDGFATDVFCLTLTSDKSYGTVKFPNNNAIFNQNDNCFYVCVSDQTTLSIIFNIRLNGSWDSFYCNESTFLSNQNYGRDEFFEKTYSTKTYGENIDFYIYKVPKYIKERLTQ